MIRCPPRAPWSASARLGEGAAVEKVTVLRRKAKLKDNERFQRVFVSSAHADKLLDLNFRTLWRETCVGKDFYLAADGRAVKRPGAQPLQDLSEGHAPSP